MTNLKNSVLFYDLFFRQSKQPAARRDTHQIHEAIERLDESDENTAQAAAVPNVDAHQPPPLHRLPQHVVGSKTQG